MIAVVLVCVVLTGMRQAKKSKARHPAAAKSAEKTLILFELTMSMPTALMAVSPIDVDSHNREAKAT